jgi:YggT family protein
MGGWSKTVRQLSDPFLRPIERRLVRRGGNPQDGSLWLLGITVVLGLVLISGVRWLFELMYQFAALAGASPKTWAMVATSWVFTILTVALFGRVISSWFGVSPFSRWVRPFVWLTEWFVAPLRRVVPPVGMLDLSPLAGYLLLVLVRAVIFGLFFQA